MVLLFIILRLMMAISDLHRVTAEIAKLDYLVDCSACYGTPPGTIDSYTCKVRCEVQGEYTCKVRCEVQGEYTCKVRYEVQGEYTCKVVCEVQGEYTCKTRCEAQGEYPCKVRCEVEGEFKYCSVLYRCHIFMAIGVLLRPIYDINVVSKVKIISRSRSFLG